MNKQELFEKVQSQQSRAQELAWQIFDYAEADGQEVQSCKLLSDALRAEGFEVETGVFGEKTAFRAVWKQGEGGVNVGFLGEYDALVNQGHACGHHLQTPAVIAAVTALKETFRGTGTPCTLTVYGTPAEETYGGKVTMVENGAFRELDIALGTHITRGLSYVGGSSMALSSYFVNFKGTRAHACSAHEGRSALDAAILSFNGIEFMREHVKDGTRMHYTIKEPTGPSNVVHPATKAGYTIRSRDNQELPRLVERFKKIIQGACLMTETEAEISERPTYLARKKNEVLAHLAKRNMERIGEAVLPELIRPSGGSTDFGNVSTIVPAALVYMNFVDAASHSQTVVDAGKGEDAVRFLFNSSRTLAGMAFDLILNPELAQQAKAEFDQ